MYDLMYCEEYESEIKEMTQTAFPNAIISDVSDYLYYGRFSIDDNSVSDDDWLLWVLRNGVFNMSFNWQATKLQDSQRASTLLAQVEVENKGI